jgi:hypothetical protein
VNFRALLIMPSCVEIHCGPGNSTFPRSSFR